MRTNEGAKAKAAALPSDALLRRKTRPKWELILTPFVREDDDVSRSRSARRVSPYMEVISSSGPGFNEIVNDYDLVFRHV